MKEFFVVNKNVENLSQVFWKEFFHHYSIFMVGKNKIYIIIFCMVVFWMDVFEKKKYFSPLSDMTLCLGREREKECSKNVWKIGQLVIVEFFYRFFFVLKTKTIKVTCVCVYLFLIEFKNPSHTLSLYVLFRCFNWKFHWTFSFFCTNIFFICSKKELRETNKQHKDFQGFFFNLKFTIETTTTTTTGRIKKKEHSSSFLSNIKDLLDDLMITPVLCKGKTKQNKHWTSRMSEICPSKC